MNEPPQAIEQTTPREATNRVFYPFIFVAVVLGTWLPQLSSSFWIDETGTIWVTQMGWGETVRRAAEYQGQSPLYFLIVRALRSLGGDGEVFLRLPSVLAMLAAAAVVFVLARRLLGWEAGWIAATLFAVQPEVRFSAGDARPYAFAVLCLAASTLLLVRFVERRRARDAVAYVVVASLMLYFHILFSPFLVFHATVALLRMGRKAIAPILVTGVSILLLLAPSLPHVWSLVDRSAELSSPAGNVFGPLLGFFSPTSLVAPALIVLFVFKLRGRLRLTTSRFDHAFQLGLSWYVIGPTVLALLTVMTPANVFVARYAVGAAAGLALLVAALLRWVEPPDARLYIVVAVVAAFVLNFGSRRHFADDWRAAIDQANSIATTGGTPVLFQSALIEGRNVAWLKDPERASYIMAPLTAYPLRGRAIPVPYDLSADARMYIDDLISAELLGVDEFVLLMRYSSIPTPAYLEGRLADAGYRVVVAGRHDDITVYRFSR